MSGPRLALYFAPEPGTALHRIGPRLLGRDAESGAEVDQLSLPGVKAARFAELTESPRLYGLHGTLKPPFRLARGHTEAELVVSARRFASQLKSFTFPGLRLSKIDGFLALTPSGLCPEIDAIAAACVSGFDAYRAPSSREELQRRRAAGLTPGQEAMLERWGYPYVMQHFWFHISLTGRIEDPEEFRRVEAGLASLTIEVRSEPLEVRSLCVFRQGSPGMPFGLVQRLPFGS